MQPRTLGILLALVVGLGAFVWFVERDLPGSDEREAQAKKLFVVEAEEISGLSWTVGEQRVALSRDSADSGTWRLIEPFAARADGGAVETLVGLLADLEKQRTMEEGSASDFGLLPPRATLLIETAAGPRELRIGSSVPASDFIVVATGDGPPFHVVAGDLWSELERPGGEWRSRQVFPGEQDEIASVTLSGGDQTVSLARRDGEFWIEAPVEDRADEGTVSRFLAALTGLEVDEFVDGEPGVELADQGLAPASATIEVTREDASTWTLELGGPASDDSERRYARAEGVTMMLADGLAEDLARAANEWRSLEWATLEVFEIDSAEMSDETGTLSFARVDGQWERDGEPVEFGVVSDLLYAIQGSKAEALDAGDALAGEPVLSVTLNPGEGSQRLEIFEPDGDRYPARASGREATLWLGGDRVRDIRGRLAEARSAEPLEEAGAGAEGAVDGVSEPGSD